jgi:hypothetical protein
MDASLKKYLGAAAAVTLLVAATIAWWPRPQNQTLATTPPGGVVEVPDADGSFADWVAAPGVRDLKKGIVLAAARGERMRELIRTNPEQAIREALTLSEWKALPPEMKALVEEPFSAVANVEVLISCGEGISETTITTEFPNTGSMETYVYGRRNGVRSKNRTPVQGIRLGDVGALREEIFQPVDAAGETAALSLYPVAVADPGGESVAALAGGKLFYFKNRAALDEANARLAEIEELPGPDSGAQALFEAREAYLRDGGGIDFNALEAMAAGAAAAWSGTPRDMVVIMVDFSDITGQPTDPVAFSNSLNTTISQQIWEMSYEKTHLVATVNPSTYRMPLTSSSYTNNVALLYTDAVALAETNGVDLSSYETICVLFPHVDGFGWAGLASIGGERLRLNGSTSPDVVIHELGHNYGSSHASSWTVSGNNPADPAGSFLEYGDFMDIMGAGALPAGHFNAWHKRNVGWFEPENWLSVSNSGTYRICRSDHRQTTELVRGLEIGKEVDDQYWVGLRQEYPSYETFSRGAYLLWKKSGDGRSYLLDTTPRSAGGKQDGGLALGQTYSDVAAGVHITPVARGGQTPNEWMDITVNLGSFPGNSAPTASLSGPANLGVQESTLFTVAASDADGDALAYSWEIGDGLVKPNTPTIPAAWLTGGTATVSCVVSDMKGGTNRVSKTVVISSPLDSWIQRTSGADKDLNDIAFGNGRLVAVGNNGTTAYSDDGINWTVHTSANVWLGNVYLEGIVFDGTQFIAVGMDYDGAGPRWEHVTYTSPDGTYWTERYDSNSGTFPVNFSLHDVAYGNGIYVAVGDSGTILRSLDAVNWSPMVSGVGTNLYGVSYGGGKFVAVGAGSGGGPAVVLTSSSGFGWANQSVRVDLDNWKGFYDVQYCNDRFLASGWYARILHSTDLGFSFSTLMTGGRLNTPAFAYGNGIYFAAGDNYDKGIGVDINLISLDGANWEELPTASQEGRSAAIFYENTFITVGNNGSIWQSDPVIAGDGGFAVWQMENKSALGLNRDPLNDADFDGHLNLEEYAMGSSATDADSLPAESAAASMGTYFQISVVRDGIKADVDYAVERAANLVSNDWSSANTVTVEDSETNLTVRSAIPVATQTSEFMRLQLELK